MTYPLALGHDVMPGGKMSVARPFADNAATWPAGSLFSNVSDLSRFAIALMNGGQIEGKRVLPEDLVTALVTGHADAPDGKYGYGISIATFRGLRLWRHDGARIGYGSTLRMFPDQKVAIIALVNRSGGGIERSVNAAMEKMLPLGAADTAAPKVIAMTEAEMQLYVGRYVQGALSVEIFLENGKLHVRQGQAQPAMPIAKVGEGRFAVVVNEKPGSFVLHMVRGADGRPSFVYAGSRALKRVLNP